MKFENLQIIEPILRALKEENYSQPTTIQWEAIPHILNRHDVFGSAQTGTGKTAAFAIPILQHLYNDKTENSSKFRKIKVLVLTPTRELAIQIAESFSTYGKYTRTRNTVIYGGVSQGRQVETLKRGVDILIATPGRLLDLMEQKYVNLSNVEYLVLDEADRMLDMGFIHDIKKIIKVLPTDRQSLFFSATMPKNILELSGNILNNPKKVAVNPTFSTAETIKQFLYYTNKSSKTELLMHILETEQIEQVLLFSKTKHGADRLVKNLELRKVSAAAIHSNKGQNQRQIALKQFKSKEIRVLVATDIASRGIDIDKLKYVINFDIPNESETYVHRIGRCGRAGEEGTAISICENEENHYIKDIEKLIKLKINVIDNNPFPQTDRRLSREDRKMIEKEKMQLKQEQSSARKRNLAEKNSRNAKIKQTTENNVKSRSSKGKSNPKQYEGNRSSSAPKSRNSKQRSSVR